MAHKPTTEQSDIYDASAEMGADTNLKVIAFAGAGKTTTLEGIAKVKPQRGIYLAFNRVNAHEAKRKLALTRCTASTFHALAISVMKDMTGGVTDHNARSVRESGIMDRFRIPKVKGWNDFRIASAVMRAMSAFANSADEDFGIHHGVESLISAIGDPEFIRDPVKSDAAKATIAALAEPVTQIASAFWIMKMEQSEFSYDMFLKALDLDKGVRDQAFGMFRYLMIDEAQDSNPVMLSIAKKTGLPLIAVGDPYQQIYSWRGAENALAQIEGKELYLTQSFRFGEEIAATARHILSVRPDGGPEQRLIGSGSGRISGHDGSNIAIICRTNVGMIDEAMRLMNRGISLHIDNMDGLLRDVRSAHAIYEGRPNDVKSPELRQFADWEDIRMEAEEGDGALARLVKIVEDGMVGQIEALGQHQSKSQAAAQVMICTAHRSKGMEWPAVQLGSDWKEVRKMAARFKKAKDQSEKHQTLAIEEYNALYVAATRPMARLRGVDRILFPQDDPVPDYEPGWKREEEPDPEAAPV